MSNIFRKKSLDRAKAPDALDDFIKVSNPGIWLLLVSIIVLLVGVIIWGSTYHVDVLLDVQVSVEDGKAICYVDEEDITSLKIGLVVKVEGKETTITSIGSFEERGYKIELDNNILLDDGYYKGKIIIDTYKPLQFIFN